MPVNFDSDEFDSALRQLGQSASATAPFQKSGMARTADERSQSEEFKMRIIMARTKLKLMRDRSDALRDSLQRFRDRQGTSNRA